MCPQLDPSRRPQLRASRRDTDLLSMNYDEQWERSFQFLPFAVDIFGA
jgi:hypothetical protein